MDKKHTSTLAEHQRRILTNFGKTIKKQCISKRYVTWYVLRTKQYITTFPDQHIRTHTAHHIEEYLNKVGHDGLKAWQFGLVADAIRIRFSLKAHRRLDYATALPCHSETSIGSGARCYDWCVVVGCGQRLTTSRKFSTS